MKKEIEKRIEELEELTKEPWVDPYKKIPLRQKLEVIKTFYEAMYEQD